VVECGCALAPVLQWIDQSHEVTSLDFGESLDRLKETPAGKRTAGNPISGSYLSGPPRSHDRESARNAKVRPRMATVSSMRRASVQSRMEQREFPKTNLTPALPIETIRTGLLQLGISDRDIHAMLTHIEFSNIPFRSHQLCFFKITRATSYIVQLTRSNLQYSFK
jgi:hypothetical protein